MKTIGQCIAIQRHNRRWSQKRLASELGITQSFLSDIENDKISPRWATIVSISEKLEVAIQSLLPYGILNSMHYNNNDGIILHHVSKSLEEHNLWESLMKTKDELIDNQKLLIETLREQIRKVSM